MIWLPLIAFATLLVLAGPVDAQLPACPQDTVRSGTICIDKWEASVWYIPPAPALAQLVNWVKTGNVAGLKGGSGLKGATPVALGVVQLGLSPGDLAAHGCPETGNGCKNFYAVSIPGVTPAAFITWFQAAAAARNSAKRLPTNQEWQVAALGTPDGSPCNVGDGAGQVVNTGASTGCVSDVGAFDMVGNLWEWVADWVPGTTGCVDPIFPGTGDHNCLAPISPSIGAAAIMRGGLFNHGEFGRAGVFAISAENSPSHSEESIGFRGAR